MTPTDTIHINLTDDNGVFLGRISLTAAELAVASNKVTGAVALVDDLASEAGVR